MTPRDLDVPPRSRQGLETLSLLSKKWHPVVVVTLAHDSPRGFNELLEAIPDVSGKVLSETLEALQDAGLVERREVRESPLRVEYDLTEAGRDMDPVFDALAAWGERHLENATPRVLLADADRRITEMYGDWLSTRYTVVRAHDGDELDSRFGDRIDVVLLDEMLPGVDPVEFVAEHGVDCRTVLLVGDRPDLAFLAVDCDDALRKPIVRETAIEAIDEQLSRRGEPPERRELASLAARRSLFESVYSVERLESDVGYRRLRDRIEELEGQPPG